jgi:predicted O-methyltransferase YrrM
MSRYDSLLDLIKEHKPRSIVEVGTWNGTNAIRMLQMARQFHENPQYIGYDLFEDATEYTDQYEFNVKPHYHQLEVEAHIKKHCPWAEVALIKGNTRQTLTHVEADFAFIDGGHSIETIRHDYEALKDSKVVVLDDFYAAKDGVAPDTSKVGCNLLVETLPHRIIPSSDPVAGGGLVYLAVIG